MLANIGGELLIIFLLALANGFFAGTEIAMVSARRSRLEAEAKAGNSSAEIALQLSTEPDRFLATVQIGITLINTFSAAFGGARLAGIIADGVREIPFLASQAESIGLVLVVTLITYISLVFGELVPKRLALQSTERLAIFAAPFMYHLGRLARPVVAFLSFSVTVVLRLLGQHNVEESGVTSEDIVYMVKEGRAEGTVEADDAQLIQRVFQMTDQPVHAVMTPRTEMIGIEINTPIKEVTESFFTSGFTRLPVYREQIDHIEGVLHVKDVMNAFIKSGEDAHIDSLVRPAEYIVDSAHVDDVMTILRRKGVHMAFVIDEYSQIAGMITLEDLLEELVGEIHDEHDTYEEYPIVQRQDGSWLVDGKEAYGKVAKEVGLPLAEDIDEDDFTSVAGIMLSRMGGIPKVGDRLSIEAFILEVVDMDGYRIDKVMIYFEQE